MLKFRLLSAKNDVLAPVFFRFIRHISLSFSLSSFLKGRFIIFLEGENEKFSSTNNFFKLVHLYDHFFFQKHLPANIFFSTFFYSSIFSGAKNI